MDTFMDFYFQTYGTWYADTAEGGEHPPPSPFYTLSGNCCTNETRQGKLLPPLANSEEKKARRVVVRKVGGKVHGAGWGGTRQTLQSVGEFEMEKRGGQRP